MTLSNRLRTELIGEDDLMRMNGKEVHVDDKVTVDVSNNMRESLVFIEANGRNVLRIKQRQSLQPTIANIKADLEGMFPEVDKNCCSSGECTHPTNHAIGFTRGYNQALADMTAAIEHYCKEEKI